MDGGIHVHPPRLGPVAVVRAVARTGTGFVGRDDEIAHLLTSLAPGGVSTPIVVTAVAGMGGVGKTALAMHVAATAHQWDRFSGGAFVVDLQGYRPDGGVRPEAVFGPLLRHLGVPSDELPVDPGEQAAVYDQVMRDLDRRGKSVLLVLDNASSAEQLRGLLPTGVHRAIVTTRDTLDLPGARHLELDVMSETDAIALLAEVVAEHSPGDTRTTASDGAARLVRVCGRLPLAVRIAAGLLSDEPGLTCDHLADQLHQATIEAFARGETTVAAVFALSVDRMRVRAPQAVHLLYLLAISPGLDIGTEAAAALEDASTAQVLVRLRTLRQAHLLGHADGRWRLHDLIRRYATTVDVVPDDPTAALLRLGKYYVDHAFAAATRLGPVERRRGDGPFADDAEATAWLDVEHGNLVATVTMHADYGFHALTYGMAGVILHQLGIGHQVPRRVAVADRVAVARLARGAADHLDDPLLIPHACLNLGEALRDARRFDEAEAVYREAVDRYRRAGVRDNEAEAWHGLGKNLYEARRFTEAENAYQRALKLYDKRGRRLFAKRDPEARALSDSQLANVLYSLGSVQHDLQQTDRAIATLRRSITLYRELGSRQAEGGSWSALGLALCDLGQFDEALAAHEQARILLDGAPDREREAAAWNNLGSALQTAGRPADAVIAHQRAADLYRDTGNPVRKAMAWDNLGLALQGVGRYAEAITVHRVARDLFAEGDDEFRQAMACTHLGSAFDDAGLADDAVDSYQDAATLYRRSGDRAKEGETLVGLAYALRNAGDAKKADECLEVALTDFADSLDQRAWAFAVYLRDFAPGRPRAAEREKYQRP
ncbi:tetratricopeptide repeat protein [Actinosynnema sp. NPDC023794]